MPNGFQLCPINSINSNTLIMISLKNVIIGFWITVLNIISLSYFICFNGSNKAFFQTRYLRWASNSNMLTPHLWVALKFSHLSVFFFCPKELQAPQLVWHDTIVNAVSLVGYNYCHSFIQWGMTPFCHMPSYKTVILATESSRSSSCVLSLRH